MNLTAFAVAYPAVTNLLKEYVDIETKTKISDDLTHVTLTLELSVKMPEFIQELLR